MIEDVRGARLLHQPSDFLCGIPGPDHQVAPDASEGFPQVLHGVEGECGVQSAFRCQLLEHVGGSVKRKNGRITLKYMNSLLYKCAFSVMCNGRSSGGVS